LSLWIETIKRPADKRWPELKLDGGSLVGGYLVIIVAIPLERQAWCDIIAGESTRIVGVLECLLHKVLQSQVGMVF
jgi:hypothetical protein